MNAGPSPLFILDIGGIKKSLDRAPKSDGTVGVNMAASVVAQKRRACIVRENLPVLPQISA
jgi:hypothetical protein